MLRAFGLFAIWTVCALADPPDLNLRVSVNLVQIDAVVTDSHGNHVTDLSAGDLELLVGGKPQTIKVFEIVNVAKPGSVKSDARMPAAVGMPPVIETAIKPADVRRTVVLFVDDFSLPADRVPFIRKALYDLIDKQMQPGDLVSIVRASAGLGAMKDFTTDRSLLRGGRSGEVELDGKEYDFGRRRRGPQHLDGGGRVAI